MVRRKQKGTANISWRQIRCVLQSRLSQSLLDLVAGYSVDLQELRNFFIEFHHLDVGTRTATVDWFIARVARQSNWRSLCLKSAAEFGRLLFLAADGCE